MLPLTPLDLEQARAPHGLGGRFYGVYVALVSDISDPDGQGRIKIRLPWAPDTESASYEVWARLATLMAGPNQGSWFVPDVDVEVLVMFEAGDPRRPHVVGALWNGQDTPPESMDDEGNNYVKSFRSRNGVRIVMDDTDGEETLTLETPAGQRVVLSDGESAIELIDSNGNSVKLNSEGITLNSSAKVSITASTFELSAGSVSVNAGMSRFSGVVQCDTLISNSVVGASYTPGAGNIW